MPKIHVNRRLAGDWTPGALSNDTFGSLRGPGSEVARRELPLEPDADSAAPLLPDGRCRLLRPSSTSSSSNELRDRDERRRTPPSFSRSLLEEWDSRASPSVPSSPRSESLSPGSVRDRDLEECRESSSSRCGEDAEDERLRRRPEGWECVPALEPVSAPPCARSPDGRDRVLPGKPIRLIISSSETCSVGSSD